MDSFTPLPNPTQQSAILIDSTRLKIKPVYLERGAAGGQQFVLDVKKAVRKQDFLNKNSRVYLVVCISIDFANRAPDYLAGANNAVNTSFTVLTEAVVGKAHGKCDPGLSIDPPNNAIDFLDTHLDSCGKVYVCAKPTQELSAAVERVAQKGVGEVCVVDPNTARVSKKGGKMKSALLCDLFERGESEKMEGIDGEDDVQGWSELDVDG